MAVPCALSPIPLILKGLSLRLLPSALTKLKYLVRLLPITLTIAPVSTMAHCTDLFNFIGMNNVLLNYLRSGTAGVSSLKAPFRLPPSLRWVPA